MMKTNSMTWRKAYRQAIGETEYGFRGENPTKEEFLGLFEEIYDEIIATHRISLWPVDPPGSHRMAKSKAAVVWADR